MSNNDLFREVFDLMADPITSPFAAQVTVTQNATDTTVAASVLIGDGLTEDPKVQLVAAVRIADG